MSGRVSPSVATRPVLVFSALGDQYPRARAAIILQGDLHQPNPGNAMLEQLVEQARPWAQALQQMDSPNPGSSQQV